MTLSHHDLHRFNEAVADLYRAAFSLGSHQAIVQVLSRLFGESLALAASSQGGQVAQFAISERSLAAKLLEVPLEVWQTHPRNEPRLLGEVVCVSDLLSRAQWHRGEFYQASIRISTMEDDLGVYLPMEDGTLFSACLSRDSRSFQAEDRLMFSLLVPHFKTLLGVPPPFARSEGDLPGTGLSRREQEVLYWVAEGKTNAEVSAILGIASGTVRRHLENIYQKLGVTNRHGAARKLLDHSR